MKKITHIISFGLAASVLLLASCVKDDLYNTSHPGTGKVTVTVDWSEAGVDTDIPDTWTMLMGGHSGTAANGLRTLSHLFEPGDYQLAVYNTPEGIAINTTTTATVSAADGNWDGVGTFVTNTPGWLFTYVQDVTVETDTDQELTAVMQQQVRRLSLVIEPTGNAADRIESIEGYLSGVAGTLDFATDTYAVPSNVELHFAKVTDGEHAGKWIATVRLLGIAGDQQKLTATLAYAGGNPQNTLLESDLTEALSPFNENKSVPFALGGTMAETPSEAGVEATITGWKTIEGDPVEAM